MSLVISLFQSTPLQLFVLLDLTFSNTYLIWYFDCVSFESVRAIIFNKIVSSLDILTSLSYFPNFLSHWEAFLHFTNYLFSWAEYA